MASEKIITPTVRLAFPALFEPKPVIKGDPRLKYQATLIIANEKDLAPIQKLAEDTWKAKFPGKPFPKIGKKGCPIHGADEMSEEVAGFPEGSFFIRTSSKFPPGVADRSAERIFDREQVYAGCYVRVRLSAYAYEHETGGRGVSFSLDAVQKVKDGERLDGRVDVEDIFDPIEDEDSDDEIV
jgi:hypothetical protein